MSFDPNARLADGRRIRVVGDPFQIHRGGVTWIACEFPDHKLRPVPVEDVQELQGLAESLAGVSL